MNDPEEAEIPQFVEVELTEDVALNNLQSGGLHHVMGEDGTHVVLKVTDSETETARSEQRFQLVENDDSQDTLLSKLLEHLR